MTTIENEQDAREAHQRVEKALAFLNGMLTMLGTIIAAFLLAYVILEWLA